MGTSSVSASSIFNSARQTVAKAVGNLRHLTVQKLKGYGIGIGLIYKEAVRRGSSAPKLGLWDRCVRNRAVIQVSNSKGMKLWAKVSVNDLKKVYGLDVKAGEDVTQKVRTHLGLDTVTKVEGFAKSNTNIVVGETEDAIRHAPGGVLMVGEAAISGLGRGAKNAVDAGLEVGKELGQDVRTTAKSAKHRVQDRIEDLGHGAKKNGKKLLKGIRH